MARHTPPRAASTAAPRRRRARLPKAPPASKAKPAAVKAEPDRRKLPRRMFQGIERWGMPGHADAVRALLLRHLRAVLATLEVHRLRRAVAAPLGALAAALEDSGLPDGVVFGCDGERPGDLANAVRALARRVGDRPIVEYSATPGGPKPQMTPQRALAWSLSTKWAMRTWFMVAERVAPDELIADVYREATGGTLKRGGDAVRKARQRAGDVSGSVNRAYQDLAGRMRGASWPQVSRSRAVESLSGAVRAQLEKVAEHSARMLLARAAELTAGQTLASLSGDRALT